MSILDKYPERLAFVKQVLDHLKKEQPKVKQICASSLVVITATRTDYNVQQVKEMFGSMSFAAKYINEALKENTDEN